MKSLGNIILFKRLIFLFCFVLIANRASGLECDGVTNLKKFKVWYPVNSHSIKQDYLYNKENIKELKEFFKDNALIDSVLIFSYSSPEGPFSKNLHLSKKRGDEAKKFVLELLGSSEAFSDVSVSIDSKIENWGGLYEEISQRYNRYDRAEVLKVLKASVSDSEKKEKLRSLNGGTSWRYIIKEVMPKLRYAEIVCICGEAEEDKMPLAIVENNIYSSAVTKAKMPDINLPLQVDEYDTKTIFALKSNLLYDALTLVNVSVEVPVYSNKFSVLYQHQFPWYRWGEGRNEYCIRYLSMCGEARWWFKPQPREANGKFVKRDKLVGHYLGVYGMGGKWDFEWKRDICYQGEFWSAGVSYGFSKPIGRRMNLEFQLSVGYASIPYRHFTPTDDYSVLLRDPNKHGTWKYFGPTKAEISLVVPITVKYKKGGVYGKGL